MWKIVTHWINVKFKDLYNSRETFQDDSRCLHVTVHSPPHMGGGMGKRTPLLSATFTFDDHIRCMAAKQRYGWTFYFCTFFIIIFTPLRFCSLWISFFFHPRGEEAWLNWISLVFLAHFPLHTRGGKITVFFHQSDQSLSLFARMAGYVKRKNPKINTSCFPKTALAKKIWHDFLDLLETFTKPLNMGASLVLCLGHWESQWV